MAIFESSLKSSDKMPKQIKINFDIFSIKMRLFFNVYYTFEVVKNKNNVDKEKFKK